MRRIFLSLAIAAVLGVTPIRAMADDDQIAQVIAKKLQAQKDSGALKDFRLGLKVEDGVVILEGRVQSGDQQKLALEIARRVRGVKMVVNDIKVADGKIAAAPAVNAKSSARSLPVTKTEIERPATKPVAESAAKEESNEAATAIAAPPADEPLTSIERTSVVEEVAAPPATTAQTTPAPTAKPAAVPSAARLAPTAAARPATYQLPVAYAPSQIGAGGVAPAAAMQPVGNGAAQIPAAVPGASMGVAPAQYDHPQLPAYAWPTYASYPNYGAVTYPRQYSPSAWPYIGPFYPYPQVPLGWRKVSLEWDDGWWYLDFKDRHHR